MKRIIILYITLLLILFSSYVCKAQDTTTYTYHIQHDTLESTTIPEQTIQVGTYDSVIFDTSYLVYTIYKTTFNVDGSITVTLPIYQIIPAHDTVFVCKNCASHDTTVITISPHPVTIKANDQNKALGSVFTFTHNGTQVSITGGSLKAGDVLTADNAASTGSGAAALTGTYAITLSSVTIMRGVTDVTSTYSITYLPGMLTVGSPKAITIKADDQGKTAGQTFTFTHDGSQVDITSGTLDAGDVITVDNAASSGSGSGAAAGTYPITLSSVTIMNGATNVTFKYRITYVGGTLTVASAPQIITVTARNQTKQYGSTFTFTHTGSQVQITSGSLASGDVITVDNAASSGASSGAAVGSYPITLSSITIMNGATNVTGNYTITYQPGTLTVTTIPVTVKANNQSKTAGDVFTFTHNGSQVSVVSGSLLSGNSITVDNAASSGAGTNAPTGSYPITLSSVTITSGATNVTSNYNITYQGGTLNVTATVDTAMRYYGMFPNNGEPTFAARLNATIATGSNSFRYNFDMVPGRQWQTAQVRAAGLYVMQTHNFALVQQPIDPYPTGAELTRQLHLFDSCLTANPNNLPDVFFISNEEPNPNYWTGTPEQYLAWLNGCVTIAHNHGVKISNGGILVNIVYYIRDVYKREGKTDSANLITTLGRLPPNVGPSQQLVIDYYNVEIPGLAASDIDYVNMHWYEPTFFNSNTSTTTSGLIPLVIKFLRSRVGKPVVTHEFGIGNNSQALFNQMCDEFKNNDVRIMLYYSGTDSGTDPNSIAHPEFWKAWLAQ